MKPLAGFLARLLAVAACCAAAAPVAHAQTTTPTTTGSSAFTILPTDARAMGMGGVLVLLPHDDTALRWNPALLVFAARPSATASFSQPAAGLSATRGSLTASRPMGDSLEVLAGELPMRRMAAGVLLAGTGFDLSEGGHWSESQFGAGFAYALSSYLTAGATLRILSNSTDAVDARASGVAGDFGVCALMTPTVELGLAVHNLFGSVSWSDLGLSESLPRIADVNVAMHFHELQGEAGMELSSAESSRIHFGAEYSAMNGQLALRTGARGFFGGEARFVPSFGVGVLRRSVHVDVAVAIDRATALGTTLGASIGSSF